MSNKIKTEHIQFDKKNLLGSYVNITDKQKQDLIHSIKDQAIKDYPSDQLNENIININSEMYDDIDRYNKISNILPIQSDMWDYYTNFIADNVCVEIDYINKTVKLINNPETDSINVKYVISHHPVEDKIEIVNMDKQMLTFNVNMNVNRSMSVNLNYVGDNLEMQTLPDSNNITQNINLIAGNNTVEFPNLLLGKYIIQFISNNKIEFEKTIQYLGGDERYDINIVILDYVISGYILDSNTNQPITDAVVDVYSCDDNVVYKSNVITTNNVGFYAVTINKDIIEVQNILQYVVRVSSDGYVGKQQSVNITSGVTNINQDLLLLQGDPTPKVLSITWIDEADIIYTSSSTTYQTDKTAIENYIYKYGVIQPDPQYGSWTGSTNSYKALIYESMGLPTNVEYQYVAERATESNWSTLFVTYKTMFSKLINNYPSAQNLKVGLFIDNSGSLSVYEVFAGCSTFNGTYDRTTINNITNQYVKEYCNWIFTTYECVTSITLNNADNERWLYWTLDFINQMEG